MNNTFRYCRSNVNITGLLGDLGTKMAIILPILRLSRWNKNCSVRHSYSYVAAATKIRFHFQFPRSPDAAFDGLIGWLYNWKCKFSCRILSSIANNIKWNFFFDGDGIDNVTLWLWKLSYFCSRHNVGAAGDDIMFHILVLLWRRHHEEGKSTNVRCKLQFCLLRRQLYTAQLSRGRTLIPVTDFISIHCGHPTSSRQDAISSNCGEVLRVHATQNKTPVQT